MIEIPQSNGRGVLPTEDNWWKVEVCRLPHRPLSQHIRIAQEDRKRGWKWTPYGVSFRRPGTTHKVTSEEEVFRFVGLPYLQPWERE